MISCKALLGSAALVLHQYRLSIVYTVSMFGKTTTTTPLRPRQMDIFPNLKS